MSYRNLRLTWQELLPNTFVGRVLDLELKIISMGTNWKSDGEMEQMRLRALIKVSQRSRVCCRRSGLIQCGRDTQGGAIHGDAV